MNERNTAFELKLNAVCKSFGPRHVLRNVSASARTGQSLVISGPNGSGKSTLVKIIAHLIRPSSGQVLWSYKGRETTPEEWRRLIGVVSPDLTLYDELTAEENLMFFGRARGVAFDHGQANALLDNLQLAGRGDDLVKSYSSGMKQRLKYAFAIMHDPPFIVLDEPSVNLDADGTAMVHSLIETWKKTKCIVVATNEPEEVRLGDVIIQLAR